MNKAKRYEAIDGLRTFSCIGIIAMHILGNAGYQVTGFAFERMIPSFTNLVFLFMTISAFGMCCGYYERILHREIDIADFYSKRYKKILPFFALLCMLDFISSPSINSFYEVFVNLTLCFGLIPNADIGVIGVGWFLGVVFAFYLIFPFFCFLLENKRRAWISFIIAIIMNYICKGYFNTERESIVFSFVYFMAGGIVFLYQDKLKNRTAKIISLIFILLGIVVYYCLYPRTITMIIINSFLLIYSLNVIKKGLFINWFTKFIGSISFEIYLCHMVIFRVIEKLHLLRLTSNDYIDYLLVLVLVFLGSIVFALVGQKIVNKLMSFIVKGEK